MSTITSVTFADPESKSVVIVLEDGGRIWSPYPAHDYDANRVLEEYTSSGGQIAAFTPPAPPEPAP